MTGLSVHPGGLWSPRQADAVLAVIASEAAALGLQFRKVDVTTHAMPGPRVLLTAYCRRHEWPVAVEAPCPLCLAEGRV